MGYRSLFPPDDELTLYYTLGIGPLLLPTLPTNWATFSRTSIDQVPEAASGRHRDQPERLHDNGQLLHYMVIAFLPL